MPPPDPEMRSPTTEQGGRAKSQGKLEPHQPIESVSVLQAEKLRRLYSFCHATALTIALLAFAGCR
jgi:hypothetical protein